MFSATISPNYSISVHFYHVQDWSATRFFLVRSSCYGLTSRLRISLRLSYPFQSSTAHQEKQNTRSIQGAKRPCRHIRALGAGNIRYDKCSPITSKYLARPVYFASNSVKGVRRGKAFRQSCCSFSYARGQPISSILTFACL